MVPILCKKTNFWFLWSLLIQNVWMKPWFLLSLRFIRFSNWLHLEKSTISVSLIANDSHTPCSVNSILPSIMGHRSMPHCQMAWFNFFFRLHIRHTCTHTTTHITSHTHTSHMLPLTHAPKDGTNGTSLISLKSYRKPTYICVIFLVQNSLIYHKNYFRGHYSFTVQMIHKGIRLRK